MEKHDMSKKREKERQVSNKKSEKKDNTVKNMLSLKQTDVPDYMQRKYVKRVKFGTLPKINTNEQVQEVNFSNPMTPRKTTTPRKTIKSKKRVFDNESDLEYLNTHNSWDHE